MERNGQPNNEIVVTADKKKKKMYTRYSDKEAWGCGRSYFGKDD